MRYLLSSLAAVLLLAGCDSNDGPGYTSSVSADDIEIVSITPVTGEFGPAYRVVVRNNADRAVSVSGGISAVDGDEVVDTGGFQADLGVGQQATETADLFDLESFDGVDCYQYNIIVAAVDASGSDSQDYEGTCD